MASFPPVPSGQSPPFATITETDHRAWIIVAASLGLALALLCFAIRAFIRLGFSQSWGLDDSINAGAMVLFVTQSCLVLAASALGLGQDIGLQSPGDVRKMEKYYYASRLFFILVMGTTRASVLALLYRLTPIKVQKRCALAVMGADAVWTLAFFISFAIGCTDAKPYSAAGEQCADMLMQWEVAEILGAAMELAMVILAIWVVWDIQIKLSRKIDIVSAFALRLVLIVPIAFRLHSLSESITAADYSITQARYVCWTQAELTYSLVSTTIPAARQFATNLATHYGFSHGFVDESSGYGSGYGSRSRTVVDPSQALSSSNHEMQPIKKYKRIEEDGKAGNSSALSHANKEHRYHYNIEAAKPGQQSDRHSLGSNDSQKMIIQKKTTLEVRVN